MSFELPTQIEQLLATLSKLYAQEGERSLQEVVVNAQSRVSEEWDHDNWNGGTTGHALYLTLPESLFLSIAKTKDTVAERIVADINKLHNAQHEYISVAFIEMEATKDSDWRSESGLLLAGKRNVSAAAETRIWSARSFRVFLSHKVDVKRETSVLKDSLAKFGISSFVAHEDVHPTKAWQDEVENALATADAFVALLTENFHDSLWTDQEVGYAFARGVPIIAVRLGLDPYGFIGKFQALSCSWDSAALEIAKLLVPNDRMVAAYVHRIAQCGSFIEANELAVLLPHVQRLSQVNADALVAAYNGNSEVRGGWGFNGTRPTMYGPGLVAHLNRLVGERYNYGEHRIIERRSA